MNIFSIYLGLSRIEFSVGFENNMYVGKVSGRTFFEGTDYESVRSAILRGMESTINENKLH